VAAGKRTKVQLEEVKRRFAAREEANEALAASLESERDEALADLRDAAEQRTVLGKQVTALESSLQTEQQLVEALHTYLGSLESELEVSRLFAAGCCRLRAPPPSVCGSFMKCFE